MVAPTHREWTAQDFAAPKKTIQTQGEGTAHESATPKKTIPIQPEGTAQEFATPKKTTQDQPTATVPKFASFSLDVPNPYFGQVYEIPEEQIKYMQKRDFYDQRKRIYFQPLMPVEAASLALLGRSFVSPEDREKQKLADRYHIKQCKRITRRRPGENKYSVGLKKVLGEKKASLMNPFTGDLIGEEGYQVCPEKGTDYRTVGSVYNEEKEGYVSYLKNMWDAQQLRPIAKRARAVEVIESEEQRHAREAKERLEREEREEREEEKLKQIRQNMEFLLKDEPVGHFGFTAMHYQTDAEREQDKAMKPRHVATKDGERTLYPGAMQPTHTGAMCLENHEQLFEYQERRLKAEEKALNGVWGMEHMDGGMTGKEKNYLFGDEMDLDGMPEEMFLHPPPSEYQQKLDALDRSYEISLQVSAYEMEEGPHCTYCKDSKDPFPHIDPAKYNKYCPTLPNGDYFYSHQPNQPKIDDKKYEVGPRTQGFPKLEGLEFPWDKKIK